MRGADGRLPLCRTAAPRCPKHFQGSVGAAGRGTASAQLGTQGWRATGCPGAAGTRGARPPELAAPQPGPLAAGQRGPGQPPAQGSPLPAASGAGAECGRRRGPAEAQAGAAAGRGEPGGGRPGGQRPSRAAAGGEHPAAPAGPYLLPARSGRRGRSGPGGPAPASARPPAAAQPRPGPGRPGPQRPPRRPAASARPGPAWCRWGGGAAPRGWPAAWGARGPRLTWGLGPVRHRAGPGCEAFPRRRTGTARRGTQCPAGCPRGDVGGTHPRSLRAGHGTRAPCTGPGCRDSTRQAAASANALLLPHRALPPRRHCRGSPSPLLRCGNLAASSALALAADDEWVYTVHLVQFLLCR